MKKVEDMGEVKFAELTLIPQCAHCGKDTSKHYALGLQLVDQNVMLPYCDNPCYIADALDTLVQRIKSHGIMDATWIGVIENLHHEIMKIKGDNDEQGQKDCEIDKG